MDLFTKPHLIKLIELVLKGKRGAGLEASLPVFDKIKKELNIPILTDIHNIEQCSLLIADHVDVLQIPAFYVDKQIF